MTQRCENWRTELNRKTERHENAEQDAGPNDEERGWPQVQEQESLARSSSSVSFSFGMSERRWTF